MKKMKKFIGKHRRIIDAYLLIKLVSLCLLAVIPFSAAVSEDEIYALEIESDNAVYGIVDQIYLGPLDETLEEEAQIQFTYENSDVSNFDESTLAVYKYDFDNEMWEHIGGEVDTDENTVTATITETGQYAMAPAVPSGTITFEDDDITLTFDGSESVEIETENIYNNDDTEIADDEVFTITASNGSITEGDEIESEDGKLSFTFQTNGIALDTEITVTSEHAEATGTLTITAEDAGDPDEPEGLEYIDGPEAVFINWDANTEEDLEGYLIYYREEGSDDWNGDATDELASPIEVLAGTSYYQLRLDDYTNYEVALKAVDMAGNTSGYSDTISFTTEYLTNFTVPEAEDDSSTPPEGDTEYEFSDIADHWAKEYIEFLASYGIIAGYDDNTFRPDNEINRAEALKILMGATGYDSDYASNYYEYYGLVSSGLTDVESGAWYEFYVDMAVSIGVVGGYSDGTFKPAQSITRAEYIKMLGIIIQTYNYTLEFSTDAGEPFDDVNDDDWFAPYVVYFYNNDIISGYDETTFAPGNAITRAEAAKILHGAVMLTY